MLIPGRSVDTRLYLALADKAIFFDSNKNSRIHCIRRRRGDIMMEFFTFVIRRFDCAFQGVEKRVMK